MFTGIVQTTAKIGSTEKRGSIHRVRIEKPRAWKLALGQSIMVDGICSTVVTFNKTTFDVEYMKETLAKTTASTFEESRIVNLERSLALGDPVDGHFVQGHVDARGRMMKLSRDGTSALLVIRAPKKLMRYIAPTGSVAVNGVSLTVARTGGDMFTVALIPHTLLHTNLGALTAGDEVNIETDLLARQLVAARRGSATVKRHEKKRTRSRLRT